MILCVSGSPPHKESTPPPFSRSLTEMPHFPIAPELPVMLPLWQQPDFAVVHLPAKSKSTMPALKHKLLSVRLLTPPLQQNTYRQLSRLLAAAAQQRVEGVVFSTAVAFGVDDVQHLVHSGYHACGNVSLVGCFAKVDAWESVPIKIERGATNFTLMDTAASMRGNSIVVFGDLSGLRTLDVHADCDVHIIGQVRRPTPLSGVRDAFVALRRV